MNFAKDVTILSCTVKSKSRAMALDGVIADFSPSYLYFHHHQSLASVHAIFSDNTAKYLCPICPVSAPFSTYVYPFRQQRISIVVIVLLTFTRAREERV